MASSSFDSFERREQLAWAAGLFEGEGTIVVTRATRTGQSRVSLALASTDLDIVERFREVVGTGGIHHKRKKVEPHHKQQHQWGLGTNAETVRVLMMLRPYLGQRRGEKADEALATLAWSRTHCSQGHEKPLDGKGCATCSKPWLAAIAARRRATTERKSA